MNFFEHQAQAERKTFRLVICYILGLFLTFLAIHAIVTGVVIIATDEFRGGNDPNSQSRADDDLYDDFDEMFVPQFLNPELLLIDLALVVLVVGGGTLYKTSQLKRIDGDGIAQMYGGVRIQERGASWKEKRLLNIVEEMAIASGIHVPNVYVLRNESGINAFAAGNSEPTSVVAVTQGALDYLSRDELEGVIAHEFSHILHHDTRLNMRLIGILFGLEMIALIGYIILRSTPTVSVGEGKKGSGSLILIVGLGLLVIGLLGQLFANIIRAAVSRQREFLADASAVQYTRNPAGISGALKKIGSRVGARVTNSKAVEGSHLFFGNIFDGSLLSGIFNTHPDLTERIRRIDPQFNGEFPKVIQHQVNPDGSEPEPVQKADSGENLKNILGRMMGEFGQRVSGAGSAAIASAILSAAGSVTQQKMQVAKALLENIPSNVEEKIKDRFGATAAVLAVLLNGEPSRREKELGFLRENLPADLFKDIGTIAEDIEGITDAVKIPIVQKAFPYLRTMPKSDYLKLREIILTLMKSDGQIDLLEFTIAGFVVNDLDLYFRLVPPPAETLEQPDQIAGPFRQVASMLAYAGTDDRGSAQKAFATAIESIGLSFPILPKEECTPAEFSRALNTLTHAKAPLRQQILEALYACISSDCRINEREGELIRAVTAYLNCPMPTWGE